jgi:serine protease
MSAHTQRPGLSGRTLLLSMSALVAAAVFVQPLLTAQRGTAPPVGQAVPRGDQPDGTRVSVDELAALLQASDRNLNYVPGEVLVKFRAGTSVARQTRALSALRSRPSAAALRWSGNVARLRDNAEPDAERLAAVLRREPEVEFAQPNYIRRIPRRIAAPRTAPIRVGAAPTRIPNDPSFSELQWNLSVINAPGAWAINPGGRADVIVAVLDTGFTTTSTTITRPLWTGQQFEQVPLPYEVSPDLAQSRVVFARDLAFEPGNPPFDMEGHGTHVASTIAEDTNNAIGLAGLAYRVRLMPVKVCAGFWDLMLLQASFGFPGYVSLDSGGCTDADIISGIRYAVDSGARVINLSLSGAGSAPAVREALAYAVSQGAFVAAAMGNDYEFGNAAEYPAAYAPEFEGMMSVGAIGKSKTRAYYSSTGSHLEVVAPGGSDFDDDGSEDQGFVWQITLSPPDVDPLEITRPRFDRYLEVGYLGTSMATPHVSALAALLISQGVTNPRAIEAAIKRSALDLGPAGRDDQYGHGLIQARTALFGLGVAR